jgi:RHS repeat-associated protein
MKGRMVPAAAPIRKLRVVGRSRRNAGFRRWKIPVSAILHRGCNRVGYDFAPGRSNHLYSVAAVTSSTGSVVERWSYNAYGVPTIKNSANATIAKSAVGNDRGFTGYKLDNETGLYFARERMYSSKLGRFISRDPLGILAGLNVYYAYFAINGLDPFGLIDELDSLFNLAIDALEPLADSAIGNIDWRLIARTRAGDQLDSLYNQAKAEAQNQGLVNTAPLDALHEQYKAQLLNALDIRIGMVDSRINTFNAEVRSRIQGVAEYAFSHRGQAASAALALTAAAAFTEYKTGTAILPKEYGRTVNINIPKTGTLSMDATGFRAGFANFGVRAGGFRFETRSLVLSSGITISAFATCPETQVSVSLKEKLQAQYGGDVRVGINVFVPGNN